MMRFIVIIVLFLPTTFLFAQNRNELTRELREKNKISEMLTYEYNISGNDSILIDHNYYNKEGKLLKDVRFNADGNVRFKYLIEYDKNGFMIKQVGYDKLEAISTILVYENDKQGNQTVYKQLKPDSTILSFQKRVYNKKGQNTKLYNKHRNSAKFYLSQRYYYRKDGQYEKIKVYNPQNQLVAFSEYEYDEKGNLTATYQRVGSERKLISTCKYDGRNRRIELSYPKQISEIVDGEYVTNDNSRKIEFDYDSDDNLIEERTFKNNVLVKKERFFYKKLNE